MPDVPALMRGITSRYAVRPGSPVDLSAVDPRDTAVWDGDKDTAKAATTVLNERLEALQEQLYAEGKHSLLVVLQAMDAGGKDSTIRHVFDGVNPQGVRVASFKKPTDAELAHDYLWRVHAHTPPRGHITIFNRSHYEDVLVVRVHDLVPEARWRRRYDHIRAFEQLLVDEGTHVVKFMLHISRAEQKERFQERLDIPHKRWKFAHGDLAERQRWDDYMAAFAEALERTSTEAAPWYIVPSDRKWIRNLIVSTVLVDLLEGLDMGWPPVEDGIEDVVIPD